MGKASSSSPLFGYKAQVAYNDFADQRALVIPNAADVLSNLAYVAVGLVRIRGGTETFRHALLWGLACIAVGFASAYFHWDRSMKRLVVDRLAMVVCGGVIVYQLFETQLNLHLESSSPVALVAAGVIWFGPLLAWAHHTGLEREDKVRQRKGVDPTFVVYSLQQAATLLLVAMKLGVWHPLFFYYLLAKLAELLDKPIFLATGKRISGHTLKHLVSAYGMLGFV